jgi:hypothetical protein
MAAVPELTKAEISAEIVDPDLKLWWDTAPAFDPGFETVELFIKLANAAYIAQVKKNDAANAVTPLVVGEALSGFSAPTTGAPTLNISNGLMTYTHSVTINGVSGTDSDSTVTQYV